MPRLSLFPALIREVFSARTLEREPEPMVMEDPEQVAAYADAGRIDGIMSAAYLFHSAHATQVLQGCKKVVDLACGPATQLGQIAQLNPGTQFHGVDLSETMLANAERHAGALGLKNTVFSRGDITNLSTIADRSVDGVISTMSFHQLPELEQLRACFKEIARILAPNAAVYLVDFSRLKSPKTVNYFAYMNAAHQPQSFTLDYLHSLRAAFLLPEFQQLCSEFLSGTATVYRTFMVPLLMVVKSPDRRLPSALRAQLKQMRKDLPARYRGDLDDMRVFFKLGGLGGDPF